MATADRLSPQPPQQPPLLAGRERELAQLRQLLDNALAGHGSQVLISGEAGIGKTTLVNELVTSARDQNCLVLTGGCYDLTTTAPYGPWVELTRSYPTSKETLPALPEQLRDGASLASIGSQSALFELVRGFLSDVRSHQALVLVLEDLHWSDPASLELLRYLGRTCARDGILLVATYRDDELTRRHPLFQLLPVLAREASATRIELQHLSREQMRELAIVRGLSSADAERLAAYLDQRTGGNPLFITELVRALESEGTLTVTADGVSLGELDESYLPTFVLQIIERRLAPLDPETRRALEVAAVIGQEVSVDVWETVSELDPAALDATIEEALTTHILEETSDRQGLRFTHALIREVLYEGVIPTRRRLWHRKAAEALMGESDPDPDEVAHHFQRAGDRRAVDWFVRAGERAIRLYAWNIAIARFETALELLEAAGTDLAQQGWLHYRIGRHLRFADPEQGVYRLGNAERLAAAAGDRVLVAFALSDRGMIRYFGGAYRHGLEEMLAGDRALEALEVNGVTVDDAVLAWVADSLPAHAIAKDESNSVWSWGINIRRGELANLLATTGHYREALAIAEPFAERVEQLTGGDPALLGSLGDVYFSLSFAHRAFGRPIEAREAWGRARAAKAGADHYRSLGFGAFYELCQFVLPYQTTRLDERKRLVAFAQANLLRARGVISDPEQAVQHPYQLPLLILEGRWDTAHEVAAIGLNSPTHDRWSAVIAVTELARYQGEPDRSWQQLQAMFSAGPETEPGDCLFSDALEFQRIAAELALDGGDLETAEAWIAANQRWIEWSGVVLGRAELALLQARFHLIAEDPHTALRHAEQALAHASDPEQPLALLATHRFLGHLDTHASHLTDADAHLQISLDVADACAAPFERALTLLELARLRGAQGRTDEARQLLDAVRAICVPLKAQPTLDQVAALEAELDDKPAAIPFGLTPRELDVLRLVAEGLTDPEVAERLFISPRTVSSHLTSVYTKLGVSSRTAATRVAVEQRLL